MCTAVLHIHGHAHVKLEPNELQAVDGSSGAVHWFLGTVPTTQVPCGMDGGVKELHVGEERAPREGFADLHIVVVGGHLIE